MTLTGGGRWDVRRVVDEAVSGKNVLLEFCHEGVGDRCAGGITHGAAVRLDIEYPQPYNKYEHL
jgi:hypothetical protein